MLHNIRIRKQYMMLQMQMQTIRNMTSSVISSVILLKIIRDWSHWQKLIVWMFQLIPMFLKATALTRPRKLHLKIWIQNSKIIRTLKVYKVKFLNMYSKVQERYQLLLQCRKFQCKMNQKQQKQSCVRNWKPSQPH